MLQFARTRHCRKASLIWQPHTFCAPIIKLGFIRSYTVFLLVAWRNLPEGSETTTNSLRTAGLCAKTIFPITITNLLYTFILYYSFENIFCSNTVHKISYQCAILKFSSDLSFLQAVVASMHWLIPAAVSSKARTVVVCSDTGRAWAWCSTVFGFGLGQMIPIKRYIYRTSRFVGPFFFA